MSDPLTPQQIQEITDAYVNANDKEYPYREGVKIWLTVTAVGMLLEDHARLTAENAALAARVRALADDYLLIRERAVLVSASAPLDDSGQERGEVRDGE